MATATQQSVRRDPWVLLFEASPVSTVPAWWQAVRSSGVSHFSELGFPTTDDEEWRFTNVAPIAKLTPAIAPAGAIVDSSKIGLFRYKGTATAVFIDGRFSSELSDIDDLGAGVRFCNIAQAADTALLQRHLARVARADDNAFVALNNAFFVDGAVVVADQGAVAEKPLHLLHLSTAELEGASNHPRALIIAGDNSRMKVIETFVSLGAKTAFTNAVTEIVLAAGANVEHVKIQRENLKSFHIATVQSTQGRGSNLLTHSISLGGALARTTVSPLLNSEGCECTMNGLFLARGTQLVDHHTAIDHAKPRCNSYEFYR